MYSFIISTVDRFFEIILKKVLFILILVISGNLYSQVNNIDTLVKKVNDFQILRLDHFFDESRDSIFSLFDSAVYELFEQDEFCFYQPDTSNSYFLNSYSLNDYSAITLAYGLINYILYTTSPDHKIRIFSWDDLQGGSGHTYSNMIQFDIDDDDCKAEKFDSLEDNTEVGYYKIHQAEYGNTTFYILFGHGTYGGGKQHKLIRIFYIENNELKECFDCYPDSKPLLIFSARSQEIELEFNEKKQEISFKQYDFNDDEGGYDNKFKRINYRFENNKLKKNNEN